MLIVTIAVWVSLYFLFTVPFAPAWHFVLRFEHCVIQLSVIELRETSSQSLLANYQWESLSCWAAKGKIKDVIVSSPVDQPSVNHRLPLLWRSSSYSNRGGLTVDDATHQLQYLHFGLSVHSNDMFELSNMACYWILHVKVSKSWAQQKICEDLFCVLETMVWEWKILKWLSLCAH